MAIQLTCAAAELFWARGRPRVDSLTHSWTLAAFCESFALDRRSISFGLCGEALDVGVNHYQRPSH